MYSRKTQHLCLQVLYSDCNIESIPGGQPESYQRDLQPERGFGFQPESIKVTEKYYNKKKGVSGVAESKPRPQSVREFVA